MEDAPNFTQLTALYEGSEVQLVKLLQAVAKQFESIAESCKKACYNKDSKSFSRLRHQAETFLRLVRYTPLLDELKQLQRQLHSRGNYDDNPLQVLFSELQKAIYTEITQIEKKVLG